MYKNIISEYMNFKGKELVGNYSLNIYNIYSIYYLIKNGLLNIPISVELNEVEIEELFNNFQNKFKFSPIFEILVYGRVENMIIKGNILGLDDNTNYDLIDKRNRCFKIYSKNNLTHILNYEIFLKKYKYDFKYSKRFDFYDESSEDIINIVNKLK